MKMRGRIAGHVVLAYEPDEEDARDAAISQLVEADMEFTYSATPDGRSEIRVRLGGNDPYDPHASLGLDEGTEALDFLISLQEP